MGASGQSFLYSVTGSDGGEFGSAIATIGDIDGDGVEDLLVGERFYSDASFTNAGRARVYSGRTGVLVRTHVGNADDENLGHAVGRIGDLDGDHVPDYLVGVPGLSNGMGAVYAYSGATGALFRTFSSFGQLHRDGSSLAELGDVDGDGLDDVAVGGQNPDHVDVWSGTGSPLYGLYDPNPSAFGWSIARCGDIDKDGAPDFVIGAPYFGSGFFPPGRVFVKSGKTGLPIMWFDGGQGDLLGWSVASLGDINGDGFDDVAAGAPFALSSGDRTGYVRVFSGKDHTVLRTTYGFAKDDLGESLASLGDINHDGVPDCIAGAGADASQRGAARIISGRDGAIVYSFVGTDNGLFVNRRLGQAVAGGDFNHDGIADVVIADPSYGKEPASHGDPETHWGEVIVSLGCPAWFDNYGTGWPGKLGVPALTTTEVPALGEVHHINITNSLGSQTPGLLMLGFDDASIILPSGAKLLVSPVIFQVLSIPKTGLTLGGLIPFDPSLCFIDLYEQVMEVDSFAIGGVSLTAGLHLRIGFHL
jgi:hypothetical protein